MIQLEQTILTRSDECVAWAKVIQSEVENGSEQGSEVENGSLSSSASERAHWSCHESYCMCATP